ncbi:MAG: hypothetical protein AW07_04135 [Candidatus Accumulibacter sp. SK-11]|nr:MAG: hypothetical protein AW07_04135 [Candidatus Accumulibacter sp. SK-11]
MSSSQRQIGFTSGQRTMITSTAQRKRPIGNSK